MVGTRVENIVVKFQLITRRGRCSESTSCMTPPLVPPPVFQSSSNSVVLASSLARNGAVVGSTSPSHCDNGQSAQRYSFIINLLRHLTPSCTSTDSAVGCWAACAVQLSTVVAPRFVKRNILERYHSTFSGLLGVLCAV